MTNSIISGVSYDDVLQVRQTIWLNCVLDQNNTNTQIIKTLLILDAASGKEVITNQLKNNQEENQIKSKQT